MKTAAETRGKPHADTKALRADPTLHHFKDLLGHAHDRQGFEVFPLPEPARPGDLAVLQYTGGTTGVAKGAMLTHRNLLANAHAVPRLERAAGGADHISLCVAPFFHVYGLTVAMNLTVYDGATMVLLPRFTVKDTLNAIEKYKPDLFPGVPTMYLALAREVERTNTISARSRSASAASAPLPLEVQKRFEAVTGGAVVEGYGLTEASPVTHCNPVFGERRDRHASACRCPTRRPRSSIPTTWRVPAAGRDRRDVVRGPQVMRGYWKRPGGDRATCCATAGCTPAISARMDDDGYFSIVDRKKDIIIASGYKIYPARRRGSAVRASEGAGSGRGRRAGRVSRRDGASAYIVAEAGRDADRRGD